MKHAAELPKSNYYYTMPDIKFVRENRLKMSDKEIGEQLGATADGIKSLALRYGIRKRTRLEPHEVAYIEANYLTMRYKEIAKELNRPVNTVKTRIRRFSKLKNNTKKSQEEHEMDNRTPRQD